MSRLDDAEAGPGSEVFDFPEGIRDLLELMLEDVNVINATLELADQRDAKTGGAR